MKHKTNRKQNKNRVKPKWAKDYYLFYLYNSFQDHRWDILFCIKGTKKEVKSGESVLRKVFKMFYAPVLLNRWIRPIVIVLFFIWTMVSLSFTPQISIGLNQELGFPVDSYMQDYFAVSHYFFFLSHSITST